MYVADKTYFYKKLQMHYDDKNLPWVGDEAVVVLEDSYDSAWNPSSTMKPIVYGPATIKYVRYKDGGIHAFITYEK